MQFQIHPSIFEQFPALRIGVIVAHGIDNTRNVSNIFDVEFQQCCAALSSRFPSIDAIDVEQALVMWRDIYRAQGANPKKFIPTVESLLRRALKGANFPSINPLVNLYILNELKSLFPIGAYDLKVVEGSVQLRYSFGNERFVGIDGKVSNTIQSEIIYSDDNDVLTRFWNYRDSAKTMITPNSKHVALFVEAPTEECTTSSLVSALTELSNQVERHCTPLRFNAMIYSLQGTQLVRSYDR